VPDRLPRELRVLYELARVVAAGPYSLSDVLGRIEAEVKREFGFAHIRLVRDGEDLLLECALAQRWTVADDGRVAIPLLIEGRCLGYLVADRPDESVDLDEGTLHLLTTVGLVAGVFIAKAEQYEELERALEELRRVDELKDDFISVASHELRTPVAIVHGIVSTLHARGNEIGPQQQEDLREALYAQSVRLRDLTEQLLDLSRFDSGRIRIEPTAFRPREAVESLLPRIAPGGAGDVRVEIDPGAELVSDSHAFERVMGNLIGNALKYGEPPVVVQGRDTGKTFSLSVEDHGPGVPSEFVPHLFERFTRADDARRSASGAGLGLAIAHEFADAVGAALDYEAARPTGARFVFKVPLPARG
jgi:signal transduction histidine kinase